MDNQIIDYTTYWKRRATQELITTAAIAITGIAAIMIVSAVAQKMSYDDQKVWEEQNKPTA